MWVYKKGRGISGPLVADDEDDDDDYGDGDDDDDDM